MPAMDSEPRAQATLSEELQEALFVAGASEETVEWWEEQENKVMDTIRTPALPAYTRGAALEFMRFLTSRAELQFQGWCEAVMLFDVFCGRAENSRGEITEQLPAICVAAVRLVSKTDGSVGLALGAAADMASHFGRSLFENGLAGVRTDFSVEDIGNQEHKIVRVLDWNVNMPTPFSWLSLLCTRFNVLMRGTLVGLMHSISPHMAASCQALVRQNPSRKSLAPRRLARGVLCIGLLGARLLPLEAFRPIELNMDAWRDLVAGASSGVLGPEPALPPAHQRTLLKVLGVAASCDFEVLREETRLVALAMQVAGIGAAPSAAQGVHRAAI